MLRAYHFLYHLHISLSLPVIFLLYLIQTIFSQLSLELTKLLLIISFNNGFCPVQIFTFTTFVKIVQTFYLIFEQLRSVFVNPALSFIGQIQFKALILKVKNFREEFAQVNKLLLLLHVNVLWVHEFIPELQIFIALSQIFRVVQNRFDVLVNDQVVRSLQVQSVRALVVFYQIAFLFVHNLVLERKFVFPIPENLVF